jgi:integrase
VASIIKKNNSPFYYIKYYAGGEPKEFSTKSRNFEVAKKIRNQIEDKLALGIFDLTPANSGLTVEGWYKEFLQVKDNQSLTYGSLDRYSRNLDNFIAFCKDIKFVRQFTSQHISNYITKRKAEIGDWSLQSEMITIKAFFNKCEELYKIPSPAKNVSVREPKRKAPNIYSQDDIRVMLRTENKRGRAMLLLDLQGGLRKGEMGSRRWKHIDMDRDIIFVREEDGFTPKDKDARQVPLRAETKKALLEWREVSKHNKEQDLIFPNAKGKEFLVNIKNQKNGKTYTRSNFDKPMLVLLKEIGIKGHCKKFRDTAASYWLACGVPPQNVRDWLGHEDIETTDHYANYVPKAIEPDIRTLFELK